MSDNWIDIFLFSIVGVALAMLVKVFHDEGIIVDSLVTSNIPLTELMAGIVVVVIVLGAILIGARKR